MKTVLDHICYPREFFPLTSLTLLKLFWLNKICCWKNEICFKITENSDFWDFRVTWFTQVISWYGSAFIVGNPRLISSTTYHRVISSRRNQPWVSNDGQRCQLTSPSQELLGQSKPNLVCSICMVWRHEIVTFMFSKPKWS